MKLIEYSVIPLLWIGYQSYWWFKAKGVKQTERVLESWQSRLSRLFAMIFALILLVLQNIEFGPLDAYFLPISNASFWIGVIVTASGLIFSGWARHHLGSNWSQEVTLKEGHHLVTNGPYAAIRHPIYTGLILALFGTAIAIGRWRGLVAVILVFVVLSRKMKTEEKVLREKFGESYEIYMQRTSALIPYVF